MTVDLRNLHSARDDSPHPSILVAGGSSLPITTFDNSIFVQGRNPQLIKLNQVIHSPLITKNLLSIHKLCQDNDYSVSFDKSSVSVKDRRSNKLVAAGDAIKGLYCLDLNKKSPEANSMVKGSLDLWHARLGHICEATTRHMINLFQLPVCNKTFTQCSSCAMGKMHRIHSPL